MTPDKQARRRPPVAVAVAVPLAALLSTGLVVQASRAASTAAYDTEVNGWRSGKVVLSTDAASTALFTAKRVMPGQSGTRCIRVEYTGNVAVHVKLWAETSGPLASALQVSVEEGTGGDPDCTGFTPVGPALFGPATLARLGSTHHDPASGLSAWSPSASESRTYRLTWELPDDANVPAQTASAAFKWDATQA
ncbi:hypothetical protein [Cellulomonas sp. URHB0016]